MTKILSAVSGSLTGAGIVQMWFGRGMTAAVILLIAIAFLFIVLVSALANGDAS